MEKQLETFVAQFEKEVKTGLENVLKESIVSKHDLNYECYVNITIDEKTLMPIITTDENVKVDSIATLLLKYLDLIETDKHNSMLFANLTEAEKNNYLLRQSSFFENDDFMFYNVDQLSFEYAKSMFTKSFEKYAKFRAKRCVMEFAKSESYEDMKNDYIKLLKSKLVKDDVLERVKTELSELNDKIEKLSTFINEKKHLKLSHYQGALLHKQLSIMKEYAHVLQLRIKHWFDEEATKNE